jgi:hypothetical protein
LNSIEYSQYAVHPENNFTNRSFGRKLFSLVIDFPIEKVCSSITFIRSGYAPTPALGVEVGRATVSFHFRPTARPFPVITCNNLNNSFPLFPPTFVLSPLSNRQLAFLGQQRLLDMR